MGGTDGTSAEHLNSLLCKLHPPASHPLSVLKASAYESCCFSCVSVYQGPCQGVPLPHFSTRPSAFYLITLINSNNNVTKIFPGT